MVRRLALIAAVGLGALIWRAPFFPQDRTLVWKLPSRFRAAPHVELTLLDSKGAVLKREEHFQREGVPEEVSWKLPLKQGTYRVAVHGDLPSPGGSVDWSSPLRVDAEEMLVLPVR